MIEIDGDKYLSEYEVKQLIKQTSDDIYDEITSLYNELEIVNRAIQTLTKTQKT